MKIGKTIILLLIIISFQACSQKNSATTTEKKVSINKNNDEIIAELKKFYVLYFSEMEKSDAANQKNQDVILQKNMTAELYKKVKTLNLDYNPIINGQDIDSNWKKTLKITYIEKKDLYEMCTTSSFDGSKYCTYLRARKTKDKFEIYDIGVNEIPSILNYTGTNATESIDNSHENTTLSKWLGTYKTTLTINKNSQDPRDTEMVELIIKKDSAIFNVDRYMGEYSYLLSVTDNGKGINLTFEKIINGDETDILKKTKDFGSILFNGKNYIWSSPYLNNYYNHGKKGNYLITKEK